MLLSILVGALVGLLNLQLLGRFSSRLLRQEKPSSGFQVVALNGVRLVLMFGGLFAMMQSPFLSVPGAALGLSVPILSGVLEALYKS